MSAFDGPSDASFQIEIEGRQIDINFDRTGPNTARVSWNIPTPANGCAGEGVYCGIVVALDNIPAAVVNAPTNGTIYTADPTADRTLHAGDRIGTSLIIGAFYQGDETVMFDVSGLEENAAYYVTGYAVDCQNRYHQKGVHAYSLDYGNPDEHDLHGTSRVELNADKGVLGTDGTGLVPGILYNLNVTLDDSVDDDNPLILGGFSNPDFPPTFAAESSINLSLSVGRTTLCKEDPPAYLHELFINGTEAATYDDLIDAINVQFMLLSNPLQSAVAPNAGAYYYDSVNEKLYQWDGDEHVEVPVIVEPTDPSVIIVGTYWYDTTNELLKRWDGANWIVQSVLEYHQDPTDLECDDYWFDGTDSYRWTGSTWCELTTHNQTKDPSCPPDIACGSFWYDTANDLLAEWNAEDEKWDETAAIFWDTDPTALAVGTLWFDDTNQQLNEYDGATFTVVAASTTTPPLFTQEDEPTGADDGSYWYKTSTEEFFKYDLGTTTWNLVPVLIWPEDPTNRDTCDLWWNSTTDVLSLWDVTTNTWDPVTNFFQQAADPAAAPTLVTSEETWYNPDDGSLSVWIGNGWAPVTFINFPTDPTLPIVGQVWKDTANGIWHGWDGAVWVPFDPIDSETDPTSLAIGTFWYDSTNNTLFTWNGAAWVSVMFSTVPLTPAIGSEYFNTTDMVLLTWNGTAYVPADVMAQVILTPAGQMLFISGLTGSRSKIRVRNGDEIDPALWETLGVIANQDICFFDGVDGRSGTPLYADLGIGDDGTPDERRELAYSIRAQLGYPVIEVELTDYQIDTAIESGLEAYRKRASSAYDRGFFFLNVKPGQSNYLLTDKSVGFNKVVAVLGVYRFNSAFLSTATGAGVYAQVVLQELYNAGSFDLSSYHLIADYIEQLEQLFATRVTYYFNENSRRLDLYQSYQINERMLVEASVERTEQHLFTNRISKPWIEKWALCEARFMLAEIRGKYGSLPGAGGGVSLNASDLTNRAEQDRADLIQQIEDYIADAPEDFGQVTQFTIG